MDAQKIIYYLRQKWTAQQDCYYWFSIIQKEEFGRSCPELTIDHSLPRESLRYMIKILATPLEIDNRWRILGEGEKPVEGDAAMMAVRSRPHHIGTVLYADSKMVILHALERAGMLLSDYTDLLTNGWKLKGFLRYEG